MTYSIRTLLGVAAAGAVALTSRADLAAGLCARQCQPQGVDTTGLFVRDKWPEQTRIVATSWP